MLLEFTFGNFRAFRDPVTLSMVAAKLKAKDEELDANNVIRVPGQPAILASAAIYGANASGKSTVIAALQFMHSLVLNSTSGTAPTGGIPFEPFRLHARTAGQPGLFQVVFVADDKRYRYGFEVTAERVMREWLYVATSSKEAMLFERELDAIGVGARLRGGKRLAQHTRPNALFLSVAAQFNGLQAQEVVDWFRRFGFGSALSEFGMRAFTTQRMLEHDASVGITELIKQLDVGITALRVQTRDVERSSIPLDLPDELRRALEVLIRHDGEDAKAVNIKTVHNLYDESGMAVGEVEFDLDRDESAGTRKLFALAGPLVETFALGRISVIDELDNSLHPALVRKIVALFHDKRVNANHAQLIFTTQNTSLLSHRQFRRDQIWFTEKESTGVSRLYSLAEFRGVRNDLDFEANYLQGRFGAVPYVGDLHTVIQESSASYVAKAE